MAGQQSFAAQIDEWARQSKERLEAVFHEATQRTVSLAIEYTPIKTGFLRASIRGSLSAMPSLQAANDAGPVRQANGDILLTIIGSELGQTIFIGYTAAYAAHVEYGTSKMAPRRFVGKAAAQWQATVNQVVSELKDSVARNSRQ